MFAVSATIITRRPVARCGSRQVNAAAVAGVANGRNDPDELCRGQLRPPSIVSGICGCEIADRHRCAITTFTSTRTRSIED
jgi:hypothetical protein